MMKQVIICDVKSGTVTTEWVDDNTIEYVDYRSEIDSCKHRLAETDYVIIKIAEGVSTRDDYEDILNERARLRQQINELEQLAKEQEVL